ncbi:MAG: 13E12 repeat family protein [Actinomycetota bacterium]|nr:13E12 repeat family protein [Actinomycetota bacterium]
MSVIVPITMLLGLDDQPGELVGYGPIPAELARQIAADDTWRRLLCDPVSGALLDHGRATYTPPAGLAEFVRARDVYCRNPICGHRRPRPHHRLSPRRPRRWDHQRTQPARQLPTPPPTQNPRPGLAGRAAF